MLAGTLVSCSSSLLAAGPADTIERVKASIVAVGTLQETRSPAFSFHGTGFVVGDGTLVVTNAHVLPEKLDAAAFETLVIGLPGIKGTMVPRTAKALAVDSTHDVALLRISGSALTPLALGDPGKVREGDAALLTGFPLGGALGIFPATHRAMIAAIVPISVSLPNSRSLDPKVVRRMRDGPFPVFQLDATAYPGNSGSPLYDPTTGEVIGVINMVFVKGTKEAAITAPSGITYAIPIDHVKHLIEGNLAKP